MGLIFILLAIVLVVVLLRGRGCGYHYHGYHGPHVHPHEGPGQQESALEVLRKRYARGEIDRDEFEQRRSDLLS